MTNQDYLLRYGRAAVLATLLLVGGACSGGNDAASDGLGITANAASFTASGTSARADQVRLVGSATGDLVNLEVEIGGATTSRDIYSFAFDLVLGDGSFAEYVPGSIYGGSVLALSGSQQSQVLASQSGDRITIGVTKVGGGSGNGVDGQEEAVVGLTLRLKRAGQTTVAIAGSPPNAPAAMNSVGTPINSISFDAATAHLSAR